jgi:hypothetical protein
MRRPFDRRVARSAPSERARGGQGWDTGEYVQMRDVVVTPATRRTRPRRRRRRAAPVPPVPLPHSFHAFLAGARNDSLKKKPPRQPANYPSLSRFANRAFFFTRSNKLRIVERPREKRSQKFSRSKLRLRIPILSIRRGGADQRAVGFFHWRNFGKPSQSWRASFFFPSHPRILSRDSSHERSFPVKRGVGCARRHSRTARVQALRSASRRVSPELSSLRARAQRARVVRTETDARARVSFRIHGVAHQRVFFRIPRNSAALRHG